MLQDGLNETHPIIQAASTPDEINALFDSISYEKVMDCVLEGNVHGNMISVYTVVYTITYSLKIKENIKI